MCLCSHSNSLHLPLSNSLWENSELDWIPSGNIFVKNETYKIMTWKWVSRWGMTFWLLWEFSATWESSAVHRQVVPSSREVPVCQRIRFGGSLTAETGLSTSELWTSFGYFGLRLESACVVVMGDLAVQIPGLGHFRRNGSRAKPW